MRQFHHPVKIKPDEHHTSGTECLATVLAVETDQHHLWFGLGLASLQGIELAPFKAPLMKMSINEYTI